MPRRHPSYTRDSGSNRDFQFERHNPKEPFIELVAENAWGHLHNHRGRMMWAAGVRRKRIKPFGFVSFAKMHRDMKRRRAERST